MIDRLIELSGRELKVIKADAFDIIEFKSLQEEKLGLLKEIDKNELSEEEKQKLKEWWAMDKSNRSLMSTLNDYATEVLDRLAAAPNLKLAQV